MTPDYFEKSDGRESSPEKHFVDDPEMIYRWEIDSLSTEEQDLLIEHYIDCPRCQARLRELFPEVAEEDLPLLPKIPKDHPALVRLFDQIPGNYPAAAVERLKAEVISNENRDDPGRKRSLHRLLVGVAALALISVAVLSRQTPEPDLTVVHLDLKNGNYRTAWRRLESMQNEFHPKSEAFQRLFEEAGYLWASDCLRQSDHKEIKHISRKLEESANLSGRVLNLEIQAERRKFNEYTTSSERFLTDYGIALIGTSFIKGTDEAPNDEKRFRDALRRFSDTRSLRLNYAQYLLSSGRAAESQREVEVLLEGNPDDLEARNVFGMSLFRQGKFVESKDAFLQMLEQDRNREETLVNLAICCMRLDEPGQAAIYFEQALKNLDDEKIKQLIEEHLAHLAEEVGH